MDTVISTLFEIVIFIIVLALVAVIRVSTNAAVKQFDVFENPGIGFLLLFFSLAGLSKQSMRSFLLRMWYFSMTNKTVLIN